MIIDRTHLGWGIITGVGTVGVTLIYVANNHPEILPFTVPLPGWLGPSPPLRANAGATPLGLIYGSVALAIFVFAALLGWRREHSSWRIGPIKIWLKAHIWLTLFTIPLVAYHCGFQGGGPMTVFLLGLYTLVMVSGMWGLALQHLVPKLMREYLPEEVVYEEIPFIRGQLIAQGQVLRDKLAPASASKETGPAKPAHHGAASAAHAKEAATAVAAPETVVPQPVVDFIDQEALPFLTRTKSSHSRLQDKRVADDLFRLMKLQSPPFAQPSMAQLQELCDEKRQIDVQTRLHLWLHVWLMVHAPASLLLVVMTFWHAVVAVFTYA